MKKLFFFASAAALLATSCSDDLGFKTEQGDVVEGNTTITATFNYGGEDGTRTELVNDGTGKAYTWVSGDGLALLETNTDGNAPVQFSWKSGDNFTGDLAALDGTGFYAVYPWNQNAVVTKYAGGAAEAPEGTTAGNFVSLYINNNQNYNHEAAKQQAPWSLTPPSGSFASGAAPAVAYGVLNTSSTGNELSLSFKPVASYFVVPVKSYEALTVTQVTLQVGSETLAGTINLDLSPLTMNYPLAIPAITGGADDNKITLNCGKGVQIEAGGGANFWFIVPAGLTLEGNNVVVEVTAKNGNNTVTSTFTKPMPSGTAATTANMVYTIWSNAGKGNAWVFNSEKYAYISNAAQFVEYVNLVSNGTSAVVDWYNMKTAGGNMSYSSLQDMVAWTDGHEDGMDLDNLVNDWGSWPTYFTGVKEALFVDDITLSASTVSDYISQAALLSPYYATVYGEFINNKGIFQKPIGGGVSTYTINGNGFALNNLSVVGSANMPYLFYGVGEDNTSDELPMGSSNVIDLTFNNATLDVKAFADNKSYYLLGYPYCQSFQNVTVNSANFLNPATTGTVYKSLFNTLISSWLIPNEDETAIVSDIASVTNATSASENIVLANTLNINGNFDFTIPGVPVSEFNNVVITNGTFGALLTVPDEEGSTDTVVSLISKVKANEGYSIIGDDTQTSYWTGTQVGSGVNQGNYLTAEKLLYYVNNGGTVELLNNINLMGTYTLPGQTTASHMHWYNSGQTVNVSSKTGNKFQISNVWIDGIQQNKLNQGTATGSAFNYLTLFGLLSKVQNVAIDGVTITNVDGSFKQNNQTVTYKANQNAYIAALSDGPVQGSGNNRTSNVTVTNYVVNTSASINSTGTGNTLAYNVGGLYASLDENNYNSVTNCSLTWGTGSTLTKTVSGDLAGELDLSVEDTVNLYNPLSAGEQDDQFGVMLISVEKDTQFPIINLYGYQYGFITVGDLVNFTTSNAGAANTNYTLLVRYFATSTSTTPTSTQTFVCSTNINGVGSWVAQPGQ